MANTNPKQTLMEAGFEPVTVFDIECVSNIAHEQSEAMGALFRAIARLTEDKDIKALCGHGALQALVQGDHIDAMRERAAKAGLAINGERKNG